MLNSESMADVLFKVSAMFREMKSKLTTEKFSVTSNILDISVSPRLHDIHMKFADLSFSISQNRNWIYEYGATKLNTSRNVDPRIIKNALNSLAKTVSLYADLSDSEFVRMAEEDKVIYERGEGEVMTS